MHILLTGATGYIGKRLLLELLDEGHRVTCVVRDKMRFSAPSHERGEVDVVEGDFLNLDTLQDIPDGIDAAYYLIHSMSGHKDFQPKEVECARNFNKALAGKQVEQVIYMSGMVNEEKLSEHLESRLAVENELKKGDFALTVLRAGIVIGSGSASFEIIRDLTEKLPVMVAPIWIETKCQPIGIRDVLAFLMKALGKEEVYNQNFDIAGPDVMTYKEMLLGYAKSRGLKRWIYTVPVMTPKLSSYWLYFITSTTYQLAVSLVDSMKIKVVARDRRINDILSVEPASYKISLERTHYRLEHSQVLSSWKDASISSDFHLRLQDQLKVPEYGCLVDARKKKIADLDTTKEKLWALGGETGWYYANLLWKLRGYIDKLVGGVGLRRGRTDRHHIYPGDSIDFWRVLVADKERGRLLLFAEMKLPGEAWLEFKIDDGFLHQTATFRPKGLTGRLYWYSVMPFHGIVFDGMLSALANAESVKEISSQGTRNSLSES